MLDSPAFRANILEGDVIIQFADKPVETVQQFIDLLPSYVGQKVPVRVIRGSQTLDIDVQL
jgi:S1-C subfamily serine protease